MRSSLAMLKAPRRARLGWWNVAALDEEPAWGRGPWVALGETPIPTRHAPARAQDTACLGEGGGGIRRQHVAALAEHAVDRVGVELDALGIDHPVVHVAEALVHHRGGAPPPPSLVRSRSIGSRPCSPTSSTAVKPGLARPSPQSSTPVSPGRGASSLTSHVRTGLRFSASCARQRSHPPPRLPGLEAQARYSVGSMWRILGSPLRGSAARPS